MDKNLDSNWTFTLILGKDLRRKFTILTGDGPPTSWKFGDVIESLIMTKQKSLYLNSIYLFLESYIMWQ